MCCSSGAASTRWRGRPRVPDEPPARRSRSGPDGPTGCTRRTVAPARGASAGAVRRGRLAPARTRPQGPPVDRQAARARAGDPARGRDRAGEATRRGPRPSSGPRAGAARSPTRFVAGRATGPRRSSCAPGIVKRTSAGTRTCSRLGGTPRTPHCRHPLDPPAADRGSSNHDATRSWEARRGTAAARNTPRTIGISSPARTSRATWSAEPSHARNWAVVTTPSWSASHAWSLAARVEAAHASSGIERCSAGEADPPYRRGE